MIKLLGSPRYFDGQRWHDLPLDRGTYLLALLCCRRDWTTREEVISLFWPDDPAKVGRHSLSQLLYRCKGLPWAAALQSEARRLRWCGTSDVGAFREAWGRRAWGEALEHYRSELLEGAQLPDLPELESWLELERRELQGAWGEAVQRHAAHLEGEARYAEAAWWLKARLKADPLADEALQSYLRLASLSGRRDEALAFYRSVTHTLEREYNVAPLEETRRLAQRLRRDEPLADAPARLAGLGDKLRALPEAPDALVGREGELAEFSEWVASPQDRLLTLLGPGGVGKTRLALEVGRAHADRFADGITFVPLVGISSAEAMTSQIATALELPTNAVEDLSTHLLNYLRNKRLLIILDNAEGLLEAADALHTLLTCAPLSKLLVTSRARLNLPEERVYELSGLSVPTTPATDLSAYGAVRLLIQRARQADVRFCLREADRPAAVRICGAVGGLPLGIALAASWVRVMSLQDIAEALSEPDFLRAERRISDPQDALGRHHSMQAVFETSWAQLSLEEQRALARLAVFCGAFDRRAAQAVAEVSLSALLGLAQKSLVQASRAPFGRFDLHPLVRSFAYEKLSRDAHAAVADRHSDYYTTFVVARGPSLRGSAQAAACAAISAELSNVRMAWGRLLAEGDPAHADPLVDPLARYYGLRGELREGVSFLQRVLRLTSSGGDLLEARVRKNLGWFCSLLGDHTSARAHLERGAEVFKAHGRLLEQAGCLFYLGETAYRQHQLEGAARRYREGLELTHSSATDAPTTLLRADLLNALGRTAYQRDELLAAQAHCEDALAILRGSGDRYALAVCLSDLGLVSLACGLPNRAEGYLEESLAIMRDLQVPLGIARALNNLANLCYEEAAYRRAEAYLIEALAIFEDLGDAYGTALADYNLGRVYYHEGAYEAALRHHQKSLLRWQVLGNEVRAGGIYNHLGRVCLALERFDEAQSYFLKSLSHAHHDHERAKVANALAGLGLLFERRGEEERAHLCLACALHLYRSAEAVPQAPKAFFDELLRLYPAERLGQAQDTDAPPNLEHLTRDLLQGWATQ